MSDIPADVQSDEHSHGFNRRDEPLFPRENPLFVDSPGDLRSDGVANANRVGTRADLCPGIRDGHVHTPVH